MQFTFVKLIVFDMDGVLIEERSSWKIIHNVFDIDNSDIFKKFREGKLTDEEFLDMEIDRIRQHGITKDEIEYALNKARYMKGLKECIKFVKRRYKAAIISGGVKCLADKIAGYGIDYVFANAIEFYGSIPQKGILNVPFRNKGIVLQGLMEKLDLDADDVIVVGDSKYDTSMFDSSSLSIAFNSLDEIVREKADIVVDKKDLRELIHILKNHY